MSKVYTSAVVIIPPQEKWFPIQEIRKIYDRQINRWMPHITLLYPFKPEEEYPTIEKEFIVTCKNVESFEITLKNFHYFDHGRQRYTLWLRPEPVELIKDLQSKILKIVPDCNEVNKNKKGFNPHLSVGQIRGKNKLLGIIKNLVENWKEVTFHLRQIFFISREKSKSSKFTITKQFNLQD
jgi:2'-5' RNA ligase